MMVNTLRKNKKKIWKSTNVIYLLNSDVELAKNLGRSSFLNDKNLSQERYSMKSMSCYCQGFFISSLHRLEEPFLDDISCLWDMQEFCWNVASTGIRVCVLPGQVEINSSRQVGTACDICDHSYTFKGIHQL